MLGYDIGKFFGRPAVNIVQTAIDARSKSEMSIIRPDQCYFQVRLDLMSIASTARWLSEYYSVLRGEIGFGGFGSDATTATMVTPEIPGGDKSHLDRVLVRAQRLTPYQVYRGGAVRIALGLYSAPGDDWAKQFLSFAQAISDVASNASITAAMALAVPIKAAFDELLRRDKVSLQLGLKLDLMEIGLREHKRYVLVGSQQVIEPSALSYEDALLHHRDKPLVGADTVLVALEFAEKHPELYSLPVAKSSRAALESVATAILKGGPDVEANIGEAYRKFAAEAMLSDQLVPADKSRLITEIKASIKDLRDGVQPPTPTRAAKADVTAELEPLKAGKLLELKHVADDEIPKSYSFASAMTL